MKVLRNATMLLLVMGIAFAATGRAEAQFQRRVYTTKFLCGEKAGIDLFGSPPIALEGPVKPGNYQTVINVHNPTFVPVFVYRRSALMYDDAVPTPTVPVPLQGGSFTVLQSEMSESLDCQDIRQQLGLVPSPGFTSPFIEGYVRIDTFLNNHMLDVVGVYTSYGYRDIGRCDSSLNPCDVNSDCPPGEVCEVVKQEPTGHSTHTERIAFTEIP